MKRRAHLLLALFVLVAGVALRFHDPQLLRELRYRAFDIWQSLEPRSYDGAGVTIVAIDDESLRRLGQWPWPRTLTAQLIEKLHGAGAAAVAFDIIYAEPDRSSPTTLLNALPAGETRRLLQQDIALGRVQDHDSVLAKAIAAANVVLAFASVPQGSGLPAPKPKGGISFKGESRPDFALAFSPDTAQPLKPLADAAAGLGSINILRDEDGVVRRVPLLQRFGEQLSPALTLEAFRVALSAKGFLVLLRGSDLVEGSGAVEGILAVRVGKPIIPTTPRGELWLYDTGHRPERFIPAWQVLEGTFDQSQVAGDIVFVGATAAGLFDQHATPLESLVPGIEVNAQVTEQMLSGVFLERPHWADAAEKLSVAVIGLLLLLCFAFRRLGARWAAVLGLLAIGAGIWGSWWAFTEQRFLFDPFTPAAVALAVYMTAAITSYLRSDRERREVRQAFGQYVAPEIVARIADHPERVNLGGETRLVTLMFCDLRGFTALSESMSAPDLTKLVNRFLTTMTAAIHGTGGTIDKYIGDCIMAFWNAPLDDQAHAANACRAVLDMRRRMDALNKELIGEGGSEAPQLRFGIGINTGPCNVGNMGSVQRLAYTAVGDPVNLASRLEGQTKYYGIDCLVADTTVLKAPGLALLPIDRLRVKGRNQPVLVHAMVGDSELGNKGGFARLREVTERYLSTYALGDWDACHEALLEFAKLAPLFNLGALIAVYDERLRAVANRAAPPGWDGVHTATDK